MTASCSCSAGQAAVNAAHHSQSQSHTAVHSNLSTFGIAVLEKTNAGNVACQGDKRSTCTILVRNNTLPFPMTLLFLTNILSVMEHVFGVEMERGPAHRHVMAKCRYVSVTTLLIRLVVTVVLYGVPILVQFHSVYYFYCLTSWELVGCSRRTLLLAVSKQ